MRTLQPDRSSRFCALPSAQALLPLLSNLVPNITRLLIFQTYLGKPKPTPFSVDSLQQTRSLCVFHLVSHLFEVHPMAANIQSPILLNEALLMDITGVLADLTSSVELCRNIPD